MQLSTSTIDMLKRYLKYDGLVHVEENTDDKEFHHTFVLFSVSRVNFELTVVVSSRGGDRLLYAARKNHAEVILAEMDYYGTEHLREVLPLFIEQCVKVHNAIGGLQYNLCGLDSTSLVENVPLDDIAEEFVTRAGYELWDDECDKLTLLRQRHWLWSGEIVIERDGPGVRFVIKPPTNLSHLETKYISWNPKSFFQDVMMAIHEFESFIIADYKGLSRPTQEPKLDSQGRPYTFKDKFAACPTCGRVSKTYANINDFIIETDDGDNSFLDTRLQTEWCSDCVKSYTTWAEMSPDSKDLYDAVIYSHTCTDGEPGFVKS